MSDTLEKQIKRIQAAIAAITPGQIAIEPTVDGDLGFAMWGGKSYTQEVTKFLAKDKPARVSSFTLTNLPAEDGLLRHTPQGLTQGGLITVAEFNALLSDGPITGGGTLQEAYDLGDTIVVEEASPLSFETSGTSFFRLEASGGGVPVLRLNTRLDAVSLQTLNLLSLNSTASNIQFNDVNLSAAITLSETGVDSLLTVSNSIVGAINELQETDWFNGFDRQTSASLPDLDFDESTRNFYVGVKVTSSNFYFWCNGLKIIKTSATAITIPDVTGTYYIYFDNNGDIQVVNQDALTPEVFYQYAIVGLVYWNATAQEGDAGSELHGVRMSSSTHEYNHKTFGARYESGFAIEGLTNGGDVYTQVTSGKFWDEDINHIVDAIQAAPFIYRLGSAGEWTRTASDLNLGYNAGGTYDVWNELTTGGTPEWVLTEGGANTDFFITFFVEAPSLAGTNFRKIISQSAYATRNAARDAIEYEKERLKTEGLPTPEMVFIGAIIVDRNGELHSLSDGSLYYDLRQSSGGGGAGSNPSNFAADIITDTTNFTGNLSASDTDVQKALETLDNLSAGSNTNVFVVTTSTYTLVPGVTHIAVNYPGLCTITIPSSLIAKDFQVCIIDSGGNSSLYNITIETEGAQTINGESNRIINANYDSTSLLGINATELVVE